MSETLADLSRAAPLSDGPAAELTRLQSWIRAHGLRYRKARHVAFVYCDSCGEEGAQVRS